MDIRDEEQVKNAFNATIEKFGGVDIVVNNASAISLTGTEDTPMKRFDLMHSVNVRGTFLVSKYAIEHLKKAKNPHILTLSPPLDMRAVWFKNHVAYTMAKYGMSMSVLGLSAELKDSGIAVNALWPRTTIWTAAMAMLGGDEASKSSRKVDIMSDAAYGIFNKNSKEFTGNFAVDEEFLRGEGITDFDQYAVAPGNKLTADFFLPEKYLTDLISLYSITGSDVQGAGAEAAAGGGSSAAAKIFESMQQKVTDDLKKEINAKMSFVISGDNWYVDCHSERPLKVSRGETEAPDVTFISDEETFIKLAKGEVKAANAFMTGKLKVKGNLAVAMKAEKIFKKING